MTELLETRVAQAGEIELPGPQLDEAPSQIGARIGRYVVLSQLGAGAMGVVLAVYDPALERKIALKLLKSAGKVAMARERLRREAQALARLNHVNVVTVHDVGIHEGQIFVAMEFVAGQTLSAWMEREEGQEPRAWTEVLDRFQAAGRGLAAAHGVGLIHRDFKPENVMVGDDGRVRVMDFGLARTGEEGSEGENSGDRERKRDQGIPLASHSDSFDLKLTQTGSRVGTPAYMAPEQFEGKAASVYSDQFSFCVALYEALYGRRPFAGGSFRELARAVLRGEVQPPPSGTKVPTWIARVVLRGLALEREERHSTMGALLDALASDPRRPHRRIGAGLALVGAFAGAVWLGGALRSQEVAAAQPCADMAAQLAGIWDAPRRAALGQALDATDLGYAGETWERVEAGLERYTGDWVRARTQACEATQAGTQSGELLDRKMACLDRRLGRVEALVGELAQVDAAMLQRATEAVEGLPPLSPCADVEALMAAHAPPEDPTVAAQVEALDARLERIRAKVSLSGFESAGAMAGTLVDEAEALGHAPLLVRAQVEQGSLQLRLDDYDGSLATLTQAYQGALANEMLFEAADAALTLMNLTGQSLERPSEAARWGAAAEALTAMLGTADARARYLRHHAGLRQRAGDYDEALAALGEARVLAEAKHGPGHYNLIVLLAEAGAVSLDAGRFEQARAQLEQALAVRERVLGPAHPDVAGTLGNLGIVAFRLGEYSEARARLEQARAIFERSHGPASFQVSRTLDALGSAALLEGDYASARAYYLEAQTLLEQLVGPEHPKMASLIANLGEVARNEGDFEGAHAAQLRARAIVEGRFGARHPALILIQTELGKDLLGLERTAEAVVELERALSLAEEFGGAAVGLPEIRFVLAQALAQTGGGAQQRRARELAQLALEAYVEAGSDAEEERAAVEAWLGAGPSGSAPPSP